MLIEFDNYYHY